MSDWEMVGKPALLFIHMQRAIVKEGSPLDGLGHSRATRESGIIPRQQALLKAFRDKGLPVIYVNAITPPDAKFPVYGKFWPFVAKTMVNKPGTPDVEVIDELAPHAGEPLFYNWPFGIFQGNDLADYLCKEGIETLVLSGVATGMAVGTAVFVRRSLPELDRPGGCLHRRQSAVARLRVPIDDPGHRSGDHHAGRHRPPIAATDSHV
jgi:nicotinamidase-related amidase